MIDRLSLVQSPCTTSGQEMERVHSYNPGARMGPGLSDSCFNNPQQISFRVCGTQRNVGVTSGKLNQFNKISLAVSLSVECDIFNICCVTYASGRTT